MTDFGPDTALVLIDIQLDFCAGGRLEVPDGAAVVQPANRLQPRFETVLLTQDWHPPGHSSFASQHPGRQPFETVEAPYGEQILWPDHCVQGAGGAELHPDLVTENADLIIRKGFRREIDSYSAFFENDRATPTGLHGYLSERGIGRLFMAGLATDVCVKFSALDAARLGYRVTVVEDSCRAIDRDGSLATARDEMRAAGVGLSDSASI